MAAILRTLSHIAMDACASMAPVFGVIVPLHTESDAEIDQAPTSDAAGPGNAIHGAAAPLSPAERHQWEKLVEALGTANGGR